MFTLEQGLESIETNARELHEKWQRQRMAGRKEPPRRPDTHDTIALLVLGPDGHIAGGCSTSGLAGKLPGRVGDSPIIGSGLYVDDDVGAAGVTGIGENVMRYCGSFLVVEHIRQGLHPQEACRQTIRRIARHDPKGRNLSINFIALDKHGRWGAAGTDARFQFAVATQTKSQLLPNPGLGDYAASTTELSVPKGLYTFCFASGSGIHSPSMTNLY
jgi:isoaspartyl peptidase/L-asparaginase-like protein (Ntn-hydrolase superfamily)